MDTKKLILRIVSVFLIVTVLLTGVPPVQTGAAAAAIGSSGGGDTTGVFRPTNGLLYLKNKNDTGFADAALNYGLPGDYPVVGDWDGNGTVSIGIYRGKTFYLRNENTLGFATTVFDFGQAGDQPIAGDWDGDGVDTIGVFRPSTAQFLLRNSNDAGTAEASFYLGNPGDVGIAGDWNGDGLDSTGVFRPSNGVIFLKDKNDTGFADYALNYGLPGDRPVMGDWDNDGVDTIGIYRNGTFYLRNENTNGFATIVFGLGNPGDIPIAGNWDGMPSEDLPPIIPATTKVLPPTTTQYLSSVSSDGITFTFTQDTPELSELSPGQTIVGDSSPAAPYGFLRKVVSVSNSGGQVVVQTEPTTIEESIQQGEVSVSQVLTPSNLAQPTLAEGVQVFAAPNAFNNIQIQLNNVVLYDQDGNANTTNDQVNANGSVNLVPRFDFRLKVQDFQMKELYFTMTASQTAQLKISSKVAVTVKAEHPITTIPMGPLFLTIGTFPVTVYPVLTVAVGMDGSVNANVSTGLTQTLSETAGASYANGNWSPIQRFSNQFQSDPPTLSGGFSLKAYTGTKLQILLYDAVGPDISLNAYLKLEANPLQTPRWTLYGGLEVPVGISIDIFGTHFIKAGFNAVVIDYRILLAQDDPELMAFYTLNNTAKDSQNHYSDMIFTNAPFSNGGIYCNGKYRYFEPDYCLIETPRIYDFNFQNFAVSVDFNVSEYPQYDQYHDAMPVIVGGNLYRWMGAYLTSTGKVGLQYNNENYLVCNGNYSLNTWHNIAIVYNGQIGSLYFDHQQACSVAFSIVTGGQEEKEISTTNYSIGRTLKGLIRNLKIFSSAITP